jgi:hypothetical protein
LTIYDSYIDPNWIAGVEHPAEQNPRGNIEINFIVPDIEVAFKVIKLDL